MGAKASPELPLGGDVNEEAPVDLIEIVGVIKWFDASKGYGFIVPESGMPDVLLHVTCLRRGGFQTAYEGARVVVEVLNRVKGLQAFRVISMETFKACSDLPRPAHRPARVVSSGPSWSRSSQPRDGHTLEVTPPSIV